jgi:DNA-binding response OmpR family regulator
MRVLVIEDYSPLRNAVAGSLKESGYAVDTSGTGDEGLWYAKNHSYDAIILDLMLPHVDGLTILKSLRELGQDVPVIVTSARDSLEDRIEGLDAGADDYLVKPFVLKELLARVRAQTRKMYGKKASIVAVGDLSIDLNAKKVSREDQEILLTSREYKLLEYLAFRADEVVSRQEIWDHVYDYHGDASSNAVDVYVGYLRKKLSNRSSDSYIQTRRGIGYQLKYIQE